MGKRTQTKACERPASVLASGSRGSHYRVCAIDTPFDAMKKRLEALGMTPGSYVQVLHKKHDGTMVIVLRDTRWALGSDLTQSIKVEAVDEAALEQEQGSSHA